MRFLAVILGMSLGAVPLLAENANERLQEATEVFREVMSVPEKGIPQELLERAHCVVIIPGVKEAAFVVGGKYGRGFAMCRQSSGAGWGAPAAVRLEGGSVGLQIGGSSTDLVMLVMNEKGMQKLLDSKFTLGADASVAAGPVGRTAEAKTDALMNAEILAWSRSKGLFAGVSLEGATLRNDLDENQELYGRRLHNKDVLMTNRKPPASASNLISMLNRYSRHEEGVVKASEPKKR
ncbi:MAG: lipid-binding SYLF domain-containing protein [Bryobacterales bacterium]|nr:lipid-binding SYLF domain-containing protein [Bryobacterales bacterium]